MHLPLFHKFQVLLNESWSNLVDFPMGPIEFITGPTIKEESAAFIPRTVYQTWENLELGRRHRKSRAKFIELNPEFSFQVFDRSRRDQYMMEAWGHHPVHEIYTRSLFGQMKADIFRYCILYDRGGFYFDISKGLSSPIRQLSPSQAREMVTVESNPWRSEFGEISPLALEATRGKLLLQWGFGFEARHVLLEKMIETIVGRFSEFVGKSFDSPKSAILRLTGPIAFTLALDAFLAERRTETLNLIAEPDFCGLGVYSLRGSGARHRVVPSYAALRDMPILI